jgi:dihydrolipoamide dehydrogenase
VTVVEVVDRILPVEDEEISALARKSFEKQGIKIFTGATVTGLKKNSGNVLATVEQAAKTYEASVDRVILAVGIVGNVENIGPRRHQGQSRESRIIINDWCETDEPGVYAIGDVVGPPWLAHKASHEGIICVEKIAGLNDVHPLRRDAIPGLHLLPAASSERRPDRASRQTGRPRDPRWPVSISGQWQSHRTWRARGPRQDHLRCQNRELLGAHMIGAEVTELIQGFTIAKTLETTESGADPQHLPASDTFRDDARGCP